MMTKAKPTPASIDETLAAQGFADDAAGEAARPALLDDAAVIKTVQLTPEEIAAAEAQRLADEAAAAEAQRLADEAAAAEVQRLADEAAAADAQRLADEAAAASEVLRLADEAAASEAARLAEVAAAAEAKPVLDMARLRGLIAEIEASNNTLQQFKMIDALRDNHDAVIDTGDAATVVRLAGIEVTVAGGRTVALTTWCSKARRAILNGEAV
jgi:hypothetical protein